MRWLALPGVPAGGVAWERLDVDVAEFPGLGDSSERSTWELASFVDDVRPLVTADTILLGHDLGGVIAAMTATRTPCAGVVLSGTALGPWWLPTRLSALPGLNLFFYRAFGGTVFVERGVEPANRAAFVDACRERLEIEDLPTRMRSVARHLPPPPGLARRLGRAVPVFLVWGRDDPWYPLAVARRLSRVLDAPLTVVPGRHYCMWTAADAFQQALDDIEAQLGGARVVAGPDSSRR